jgi:outer membrane protein TolC
MSKKAPAVFLLCLVVRLHGQDPLLENYIEEGLKNNLALRQKEFSFRRSMAALNEARGMFLPSVGIEARYTRAGGGRIIDIPIGDLMNPVYGTLNTILGAFGQPPPFPTDLPNEHIPFLREHEQETKVRVVQPVFQPVLWYNAKIRRALSDIESLARDAYARQLAAEIQTAYYNVLKTERVAALLRQTGILVKEHVRVTESLFNNGKASQAAVFRARAEVPVLAQEQAGAEKNRALAAAYFNFLLNRPLDAKVETEFPGAPQVSWTGAEAESLAVSQREELKQLRRAVDLMGSKVGLSAASMLPGLAAVVDWGFWDEEYRFTRQTDYWTASVVATWNLFNGFQDKSKIDQAKLERREKQAELESVETQIRLQAKEAFASLNVAHLSAQAAMERLSAARKFFDLTEKKYREGMAPQIELIDARNTLTQAEVNEAVCKVDVFIRVAELEKAMAVRPIRTLKKGG